MRPPLSGNNVKSTSLVPTHFVHTIFNTDWVPTLFWDINGKWCCTGDMIAYN